MVLTLVIPFSIPASAAQTKASAGSCFGYFGAPESDSREVLRAYRDAWLTDDVYCPSYCHKNVIKLFDAMKSRAPTLSPKEISVIIITHQEGEAFYAPRSRQSVSRQQLTSPWIKHVVLRYKSFVLDLDNSTQPKAYSIDHYVHDFFFSEIEALRYSLHGSSDELVARSIPLDEYRSYAETPLEERPQDFFDRYPAVPFLLLSEAP